MYTGTRSSGPRGAGERGKDTTPYHGKAKAFGQAHAVFNLGPNLFTHEPHLV